jgi:hypothetical protein
MLPADIASFIVSVHVSPDCAKINPCNSWHEHKRNAPVRHTDVATLAGEEKRFDAGPDYC